MRPWKISYLLCVSKIFTPASHVTLTIDYFTDIFIIASRKEILGYLFVVAYERPFDTEKNAICRFSISLLFFVLKM